MLSGDSLESMKNAVHDSAESSSALSGTALSQGRMLSGTVLSQAQRCPRTPYSNFQLRDIIEQHSIFDAAVPIELTAGRLETY